MWRCISRWTVGRLLRQAKGGHHEFRLFRSRRCDRICFVFGWHELRPRPQRDRCGLQPRQSRCTQNEACKIKSGGEYAPGARRKLNGCAEGNIASVAIVSSVDAAHFVLILPVLHAILVAESTVRFNGFAAVVAVANWFQAGGLTSDSGDAGISLLLLPCRSLIVNVCHQKEAHRSGLKVLNPEGDNVMESIA